MGANVFLLTRERKGGSPGVVGVKKGKEKGEVDNSASLKNRIRSPSSGTFIIRPEKRRW